jgi:hypothetical protein
MVLGNLDIHLKRIETISLYLGSIKSNSTWIEDITTRPDTLKLLKESNSIYKHSHGLFE